MFRSGQGTDGFVLVDALVAVALVAAAGTAIYLLGHDMLRQQDRRLDRLVAMMNLNAIAKQIAVLGSPPVGEVRHDRLYTYVVGTSVEDSPNRLVASLIIEAVPKGGGRPIVVFALVPAAHP